jgi:GTP-binding protein HflX
MVFNKVDKVDGETLSELRNEYVNAIFISAKEAKGIDELKEKIISVLF